MSWYLMMSGGEDEDSDGGGPAQLVGFKRGRSGSDGTASSSSSSDEISEDDINTCVRDIGALAKNLAVFRSRELRDLRGAAYPFFARQGVKGAFQGGVEQTGSLFSAKDIDSATTLRVLLHFEKLLSLGGQEGVLAFRSHKALRRALYHLADAVGCQQKKRQAGSASYVSEISQAFENKDWDRAYSQLLALALGDCARARSRVRAGTMQRWVREADVLSRASEGGGGARLSAAEVVRLTNTSWMLLDLVLRIKYCGSDQGSSSSSSSVFNLKMSAQVRRTAPFDVLSEHRATATRCGGHSLLIDAAFREKVTVVHHVGGRDRRPPSLHDLNIYATAPGLLGLRCGAAAAARVDVPGVPGAFVIVDALSDVECQNFIAAAEAIGYQSDAVEGIENITWLADSSICGEIFERSRPFLQPQDGRAPVGLNPRLRLFRYLQGTTYRPHIDGSWVEAGIDASGAFCDDVYGRGSARSSRYTFLLYLNDDFEGGGTTFFVPVEREVGAVDALAVRPRRGCALVFPHGEADLPLVHEGSALTAGVKYVIRTDVIYKCQDGE